MSRFSRLASRPSAVAVTLITIAFAMIAFAAGDARGQSAAAITGSSPRPSGSTSTSVSEPPPPASPAPGTLPVPAQLSSSDSLKLRYAEELQRQGFSPEEIRRRIAVFSGDSTLAAAAESTAFLPDSIAAAKAARAESLAALTILSPGDSLENGLPVFGRSLFTRLPASFVPPATGSAGPSYIVGPDDELLISIWGKTQLEYRVTVTREGDVNIPEVGLIQVAGRSLADVEELARRHLARYYSGIQVRVTVARLRALTVYVVGEVTRPGAYTLSSLSTVIHALYAAGGPTMIGSLRHVRFVLRDGTAREVDFYQYLLHGDDSADPRVEDGSTVFVPPVGQRVGIRGEVRRPARYELRGGETVQDLIDMAGGTPATAYLDRISLDRVFDGRERRLVDVSRQPGPGGQGFDLPLADGDEVYVFPIVNDQVNRLDMVGSVRRPGMYELRPGMRALDLIDASGGVTGDAYLTRAEIRRTHIDGTREVLGFDLGEALLQGRDATPALQPRDSLMVFSGADAVPYPTVTIAGEVKKPGSYPLGTGMSVADLVSLAGGLTPQAYLERAEVARVRPQEGKNREGATEVLGVSLVGDAADDASGLQLQQGDRVYIRSIPNRRDPEAVTLEGEVRFPGTYPILEPGETLSSVIERAGGVTEKCHLSGVTYTRKNEGRVLVDADRLVRRQDTREDIVLHDGDRVTFPRIPETVRVSGAVFSPGAIKYVPGKTAAYYLARCGGTLKLADRKAVRIVQANGSVDTAHRFWFDPKVQPGAVIQVPIKEPGKTDWGGIIRDGTSTIASVATVIFFTRELSKR